MKSTLGVYSCDDSCYFKDFLSVAFSFLLLLRSLISLRNSSAILTELLLSLWSFVRGVLSTGIVLFGLMNGLPSSSK